MKKLTAGSIVEFTFAGGKILVGTMIEPTTVGYWISVPTGKNTGAKEQMVFVKNYECMWVK